MSDYVLFIILSTARTGSTMLVQALNSHPRVRCFREVFNARMDYVDFSMEGYDNFNQSDIALRQEDPSRFLRERVFREWPPGIRAVGFKLLYENHADVPTLVHDLTSDSRLRVIHLRRRNELRTLVSEKKARMSGVWVQDPAKINRARLLMAVRHPLRAASRMRRVVAPAKAASGPAGAVTVSHKECAEFIVQTRLRAENYDKLFAEQAVLPVSYEDMIADHEAIFAEVQAFLGLEPATLKFTVRQQNPEPLRDLIANYDELYDLFKHNPDRALFS
jgi:LPS sulfotransferase NodH